MPRSSVTTSGGALFSDLCSDIAEASIAEAISDALRHSTGRERLVAFFRRYAEIICDDFGRGFVLRSVFGYRRGVNSGGHFGRASALDRARAACSVLPALCRDHL